MKNIYIFGSSKNHLQKIESLRKEIDLGLIIKFKGELVYDSISKKEVLEFIVDNGYEMIIGDSFDFKIEIEEKRRSFYNKEERKEIGETFLYNIETRNFYEKIEINNVSST